LATIGKQLTEHPTAQWTAQHLVEAFSLGTAPVSFPPTCRKAPLRIADLVNSIQRYLVFANIWSDF
jgi:hypothetical protein